MNSAQGIFGLVNGLVWDVPALASSWTLAGIFLFSALHKLRNFLEFRGILSDYRILPQWLASATAPMVIVMEALAGLMLLSPAGLLPLGVASIAAATLLCLYTYGIGINLFRGRTSIDCGCGSRRTPLSAWLLVRNALLLALAWTSGTAMSAVQPPSLYLLSAGTTLFLWVAYASGNQLLANHGGARRISDMANA